MFIKFGIYAAEGSRSFFGLKCFYGLKLIGKNLLKKCFGFIDRDECSAGIFS
jgi:hypothetical protein